MKSQLWHVLFGPAAAVIFIGCASHCVLVKKTTVAATVSPHSPSTPSTELKKKTDSCAAETRGETIDSLIQNADAACDSEDWAAAHKLLKEAAASVKAIEANGGGVESEEYYNDIALRYTERLPEAYADSAPDEVSLISFQKQLGESMDSITLSSADSAALQKMVNQKKAAYSIPIVWNDRVYKALCFLNRGGKGPLDKWIARSNYYLPVIKKMFSDSGVPEDIAYLPLIESGFNPLAYSRKKAAGMWQFIPSTGKVYGLQKDFWVDQRRDFIASTKAAISYFKKLYNQFNDWHIALASYNCGENSMCRALAKSSVKNYWSLSKLPKETRHYVPEFLAALIVAKNPNYTGVSNAPAAADTFNLDSVTVSECLSLYAIADSLGIPYAELREINPHIMHWCSHPRTSVVMYLPKGKKDQFLSVNSTSPSAFSVAWYSYQVKQGESPRSIARHFKVPLDALLALNALTPTRRLSVGMELFIPIPINQSAAHATAIKEREIRVMPSYKTVVVAGAKVIKYRVRSGDCLWSLSQLFSVDIKDMRTWNDIRDDGPLKAGMVLTIYKSSESLKSVIDSSSASNPLSASAAPAPSNPAAPAQAIPSRAAYSQATAIDQSMMGAQQRQGRVDDASAKRIVYYKVRKGDNLWNIAQSFKVPVRELTTMNDITLDTTLFPGVVLKVPLSERL